MTPRERASRFLAVFRIRKGAVLAATLEAEIAAAEREARLAAIEECAQIIKRAASDEDSEIASEAADAFNGGSMRRSAAERLKDWSAVIERHIRTLAAKEKAGG